MTHYIPEGFPAMAPMLAFRSGSKAIAFYEKAFDAEVVSRMDTPTGGVAHAELKIGDGFIMLADEDPKYNTSAETLGNTSVILHLYVPDVDAFFEKAKKAGCEEKIPLADQFYGDRSGRLQDPFGYLWTFSTHTEDVPPEIMEKRAKELFGG